MLPYMNCIPFRENSSVDFCISKASWMGSKAASPCTTNPSQPSNSASADGAKRADSHNSVSLHRAVSAESRKHKIERSVRKCGRDCGGRAVSDQVLRGRERFLTRKRKGERGEKEGRRAASVSMTAACPLRPSARKRRARRALSWWRRCYTARVDFQLATSCAGRFVFRSATQRRRSLRSTLAIRCAIALRDQEFLTRGRRPCRSLGGWGVGGQLHSPVVGFWIAGLVRRGWFGGSSRRGGKMDDTEVSKQVQQMVQFIRQEAEEKANEISVSAEEEFNIEKLQIVEAEKKKIRQEFERKEKQVEVRRKIEYSTQLNASRLKLLQAQDDLVRTMKDAAEKQLQKVGSDDNESYPKLLEALIIQALLRLKEPATQLRCREQDLETVQSVIESAKKAYAEKLSVDVPEVFVDDKHFLPGPPESNNHGSSCTGGVVLATKDGRIVLENTLDARLEVVFKQQLPEIRKRLFPAGGQAGA